MNDSDVIPFSRRAATMACAIVGGAFLLTHIMIMGHHYRWAPIANMPGFNFLILTGFVQQKRPAPFHLILTLAFSVLFSATLAYGLWSWIGAFALGPALALLAVSCLLIYFFRDRPDAAQLN